MRIGRLAAAVGCGIAGAIAFGWYRRWHLRWGATVDEVHGHLPGDAIVPVPRFEATRAVTIDAPPAAVWPWLAQIGRGRAGFYAYDLLDNAGEPSAERILPEHQHLAVGDLAAPMALPADDRNSFRVFGFEEPEWLGWAKPGSTWVWVLRPLDDGQRTRLVVRLKATDRLPWSLVSAPLLELGDFPMMRKELLGIKARAEAGDGSALTGGR